MSEDKLKIAVEALKEITKGKGVYSRDLLTHATNTIENLITIAKTALEKIGEVS